MPFCPQCNSEYEDWVQTCADCGVPLTRGAAQSSNFMRSMFRPIGTTPTSTLPHAGGEGDSTQSSALSPQPPALPRHQGRNRRLKTRFLEPFHPPAEMPAPPPLPPDAVLPIALNLDLNHPRSTYDPAGDAWVVLISAPNEIMANLLRSQLGDAGIPALIKLNSAVDNGEFINNAWVARNIWVQARDVERARDVVNFYHSDSPLTPEQQAAASVDENYSEMERPPLYETPWLPNEHYDDPDMIAANSSVDEHGRPIQRNAYRSPLQRPWLRWLSFILLLAWVSPYLVDLLTSIWQNLGRIFR